MVGLPFWAQFLDLQNESTAQRGPQSPCPCSDTELTGWAPRKPRIIHDGYQGKELRGPDAWLCLPSRPLSMCCDYASVCVHAFRQTYMFQGLIIVRHKGGTGSREKRTVLGLQEGSNIHRIETQHWEKPSWAGLHPFHSQTLAHPWARTAAICSH